MKNILVDLSADYGADCMGCGYGSEESENYEVSEEAAATLKAELEKSEEGTLSMEDIEELIEAGHEELEEVHEAILADIHEMEIKYWLEEGLNTDAEGLYASMDTDLANGTFKPSKTLEEFCQEEGIDMKDEDFDPDYCEEYQDFIDEEYREWVSYLDLDEQAEKVGLDIDAVLEDSQAHYTITSLVEE